ncbi:surfeit locus protein 2 [Heteronotia binoei]|uniref:surfeit locus protein 2 n=1 Tax=Heteronotia binoei TaxID=13085 RepID=UPI00292E223F|nr:surfeit locus protein 2 [Heteronotia binoei]
MNEQAEPLELFLAQHPALRVLPPGSRVQCTLTGHELPCQLAALQAYTSSRKYLRLNKVSGAWDYRDYEPHIVPSTKNRHQLFCKLTLRHFNRTPEQVLHHVQGHRYQKALKRYEECQKAGVEYVPACLLQRRRRWRQWQQRDQQPNSSRQPCQKGEFWEPLPSDEDGKETDDSMSDLYPPEMFPERSPAGKEGSDEFMTDSDEEVAKPAMEAGKGSKAVATGSVVGGKRGKKQTGGSLKKKLKSQHRKPRSFRKAVNGNDVM